MKKWIVLALLAVCAIGFADTYIQVMCEPGVKIFLDGTLKGVLNTDDGGLIIDQVVPGTHAIKAVRAGFAPQEDQLPVKNGEVKVYQRRRFVPEVQVSQEGQSSGGSV